MQSTENKQLKFNNMKTIIIIYLLICMTLFLIESFISIKRGKNTEGGITSILALGAIIIILALLISSCHKDKTLTPPQAQPIQSPISGTWIQDSISSGSQILYINPNQFSYTATFTNDSVNIVDKMISQPVSSEIHSKYSIYASDSITYSGGHYWFAYTDTTLILKMRENGIKSVYHKKK